MKTTREIARAFLVTDRFVTRHIGPSPDETEAMLATLGYSSLDEFIDDVVPADIRLSRPLNLPPGRSEREVLQALRGFAAQNQLFRSHLGMGYYPCFTPQVIQRNIVENPGWYTAYTPYQPEIAQGRLEALLNYQTVVSDLTGLPIANASLLDEATAAAEAVHLTQSVTTVPAGATPVYLVAESCHPQTIAVLQTRAGARGLKVQVADPARFRFTPGVIGALVLLAVMASMYAVYHGPEGLRRIAQRVHTLTVLLAAALSRLGYRIVHPSYFDTLCVEVESWALSRLIDAARARRTNLRTVSPTRIGISLDETTTLGDLADLVAVFSLNEVLPFMVEDLGARADTAIPERLRRTSPYLTHPVFHKYRSETEMLRYIKKIEARDLSLTSAMIPLGSCTMKLNATTEMAPLSWREFNRLHPFAPREQAQGYRTLFRQLEQQLAEITGFPAVSLQPNSGAQGELTGLLVVRAYHTSHGEGHRDVCLIPTSAHGTHPASAVMAGFRVVPVRSDARGNIDVQDLKQRAAAHRDRLAAIMITYPSTHGVFETSIRDICRIVHEHGGQVYMDGANMNAQVGLCRPADFGADLCHLNLHKTFCIPHGGGGPGMGPVCAAEHLAPFLPDHPVVHLGRTSPCGTVSAAPWGSAWILPISWAYVALMGREGLVEATRLAILNANYIAKRLSPHYGVL